MQSLGAPGRSAAACNIKNKYLTTCIFRFFFQICLPLELWPTPASGLVVGNAASWQHPLRR
eukprot:7531243-Karenia_brevis.AAC.1